jgi:hypothetical protein
MSGMDKWYRCDASRDGGGEENEGRGMRWQKRRQGTVVFFYPNLFSGGRRGRRMNGGT